LTLRHEREREPGVSIVTRLFAGTPWDRPPACDRCGKLESECACPPPVVEPKRLPPETQTARLAVEKRPRGKAVTVIGSLDPEGNDLPALAAKLKSSCGTGGTLKDGRIELQGNHLQAVESALKDLGYKTELK
jgi:translation initiation factor 1